MTLTNINEYVASKDNLTKIEVTAEVDEYSTGFYVVKTKETYVYESEDDADAKINEARQSSCFESAKKTYKAGKLNKAGDVVKPETYVVVVVLKY